MLTISLLFPRTYTEQNRNGEILKTATGPKKATV